MASRKSKTKARDKSRAARRWIPQPDRKREQNRAANPNKNLGDLKPSPFDGEMIEDLAVFAKASREQLPGDLQIQAGAIGQALDLVYEGHFEQAMEGLKSISRSSPFSDWRLFVRGLISFYNSDLESARKNWLLLDRARRPARIASTLLLADTKSPLDNEMIQPPQNLVAAAKELRFRPRAVAAAGRIAAVRHRNPEQSFSASQIAMLHEFRDDYRSLDSEFVKRFSQACVRLAYFQPNSEIFELLKKSVPGPPHDPTWNLQGLSYYLQFEDAEESIQACAKAYMEVDLPRLAHMPDGLKRALASSICMRQAAHELQNQAEARSPFFFMNEPPDLQAVEQLLREATKRYPANRKAHKKLIEVLQMRLDEPDLNKRTEAGLEKGLVIAKEALVKSFPDEVDTTLWLIDHYFEEDELEQAHALVKQLSEQRIDCPLAKALPWKLKLLEAMRLNRRKTSLVAAREALNAAEAMWPKWFSQVWLPFLKAAIELRAGDRAQFDQLIVAARAGCTASPVVGDVMTFAALQQMNLPSAELKPFRELVERHALGSQNLLLTELCKVGSFFWNLCRTGLQHKAYRLQASKFGKVLCSRLKSGERVDVDPAFLDACSWVARHGFWMTNFTREQPAWIAQISAQEPKAAAAVLEWLLDQSYSSSKVAELQPQIVLLQAAARTENDPFYRHRFEKIATEAVASTAEFEARRRSRDRFDPFVNSPRDEGDSSDDDDVDDVCNCPECRARRARQASSRPSAKRKIDSSKASATPFLFDVDDDDDDDDDDEFDLEDYLTDEEEDYDEDDDDEGLNDGPLDGAIPAVMLKVFSKLGPTGIAKLAKVMERAASKAEDASNPFGAINLIAEFFHSVGLSANDAVEFLLACNENPFPTKFVDDLEPPQPIGGSVNAQERRANRKQRRKQLQNKRKKLR